MMRNRLRVGVVLIVVGLVGLLVLGATGWGGPWAHRGDGPMMRQFGRRPMSGYSWRGSGGTPMPPIAGARTVEIVATESSFTPSEMTAKVGEAFNLQLVNRGSTARALVIPSLGIRFVAFAGQSVTSGVKVDRPGEYEVFSGRPGRRGAGMIGRIIVTP